MPLEIPQSLAVGARVLGYHHKALKKGVVQSTDAAGSRYRILFEGHSTSLWIKDVDLMVYFLYFIYFTILLSLSVHFSDCIEVIV